MGHHSPSIPCRGIYISLFGITKMNERIKELAEQARNYALDEKRIYERVNNTEQCMEEYREVYNKKFAELIVWECIGIVKQRWINPNENVIAEEIKQHFGVEE
jgi:uncharacterized membrane protein